MDILATPVAALAALLALVPPFPALPGTLLARWLLSDPDGLHAGMLHIPYGIWSSIVICLASIPAVVLASHLHARASRTDHADPLPPPVRQDPRP